MTRTTRATGSRARRPAVASCLLAAGVCILSPGPAPQGAGGVAAAQGLEATRLAMGKWIETQQILARERKDWQQGKEVLLGRLELVKKEISTLDEKIQQAGASVAEAHRKRAELVAQTGELEATVAGLTEAVTGLEAEVRRLHPQLPEPVKARIEKLYQRIPEDPTRTRVTAAERFQNVLGILNELNKANQEITPNYEVHSLAGGRSAEVQALYLGLAQAWYVSAQGEAGIGRPSAAGWTWEPRNSIAGAVLKALEIQQGKQSPAFVPLPVRIQ